MSNAFGLKLGGNNLAPQQRPSQSLLPILLAKNFEHVELVLRIPLANTKKSAQLPHKLFKIPMVKYQ